jgi:threonine dehydrogenase-like Zn-dependent dehydrogenase
LCEAVKVRGVDLEGTAAEVVAVDRQEVTVLPDGLTNGIAVGTAGTYVAPVAALGRPEPGQSKSAVVTDVDSDVGLASAHVLARAGWEVVVVGRDPERRRAAGQVGAVMGVDPHAHPRFSDATLDVTQGKGAALVVDTTGVEEVVAEALRGRALRGRLVLLWNGPERVAVPVGIGLERPLASSSHAFLPAARFLEEGPAPGALVREEVPVGALGGVEVDAVDGRVVTFAQGLPS